MKWPIISILFPLDIMEEEVKIVCSYIDRAGSTDSVLPIDWLNEVRYRFNLTTKKTIRLPDCSSQIIGLFFQTFIK